MKKIYIAPEMEVMKMDVITVLATSGEIDSLGTGGETDGADGALGREDDNTPSNPNLWEQGW